jgi:hypothetical protein
MGICCDIGDFSTAACNDRLQNVTCSSTLVPQGSDEPPAKAYLVCPQSEDVCGANREFLLQTPDLLDPFSESQVQISSNLPSGYVCTYSIRVDQKGSVLEDQGKSHIEGWMSRLLIDRPHGEKSLHNDKLDASLFYSFKR